MKKILLSLVLCIAITSLFAQTINISTGDGTTANGATDPNWKVNSTNAYTVASYLNYWQPTPIQGCGARWLNPTATVMTQAPGYYTFERNIPVPSGIQTLSLSFQVAYDDVLTALEIVPPVGPAIALTAVNPKAYYLSNVINSNIEVCNKSGNWKIRAKVQYIDALGAFMLCGTATLKGSCCDCGKWGTTLFSGTGINKQVSCGQTIIVKKGVPVSINPSYACAGNCKAKFSATLTSPSGQVQNINSFPYTLTPNELCTYKLTITPICGDRKCGACTITIFSASGCPGDIVSTRRLIDFDYLDIANYTFDNVKAGSFATLEVNAKEELFAGVPNGSYRLSLEKKEVQLISNLNNNVVERYKASSYIPGPNISCQQQEDDQWETFRRDVAPGLAQRANQTCQAVMYCLQIDCNGSPHTYFMMIFKPTSKKCLFSDATLYNQAIVFSNLIAE